MNDFEDTAIGAAVAGSAVGIITFLMIKRTRAKNAITTIGHRNKRRSICRLANPIDTTPSALHGASGGAAVSCLIVCVVALFAAHFDAITASACGLGECDGVPAFSPLSGKDIQSVSSNDKLPTDTEN